MSKNELKGNTTLTTLTTLRRKLLDEYRDKQQFRVSIGKSKWIPYEKDKFSPIYNLREILNDEIVIEFDCDDLEIVMRAISQTGINLYNAGYYFEYWEHGGKSPHLHIKDLPIAHLDKDKLRTFKRIFVKKYVPEEYHKWADFSLTGIHVIALEWQEHWKGKYGIKKLISIFDGKNDRSWGYKMPLEAKQ